MKDAPHFEFASDNAAGICPEALAALSTVNPGHVASYGNDAETLRTKKLFAAVFEKDCEVFFVFNGTAANALVFAALGQRHQGILCHALSHVDTDECGAPEFFTGGSKVIPLDAPFAKLRIVWIFGKGAERGAGQPEAAGIAPVLQPRQDAKALGIALEAQKILALGGR